MKSVYLYLISHSYAFIIVVALLVYFNLLFNNFVWLDNSYILQNPEAKTINLYNLFHGSSLTAEGFYRPISALYLTISHTLFQDQPFFYHIIQLTFRIVSTILLFKLFGRFFNKTLSLLLALVYLVHPINESQLAFISSAADILFITFGLSALMIATMENQKKIHFFAANLFLLLSLLSKESGILFYIIIILYQFLFKRRYFTQYFYSGISIIFLYIGIRFYFHGFNSPVNSIYPMAQLSYSERLINIPQIFYFYISKFFIPINIGGLHIWTLSKITVNNFYLPLLVDLLFLISLSVCGYFIYLKKHKNFNIFILFITMYLLGQILYLQIIPLDYTVSSRWFAFSMIGLLGVIGTVVHSFQFTAYQKKILIIICVVVISIFAVRTIDRNSYWKDDISLFTHWAEIDNNFVIQNWLANAYINQQDYKNALVNSNKSVEMFPYDNNLAVKMIILERLGDIKQAKITAEKAINADNYGHGYHDEETYTQLIQFLLRNNENNAALQLSEFAVEDYPKNAYFWSMLAAERYILGDRDQALIDIEKANKLSPEIFEVQKIRNAIINKLQL